MSNGFFTSYPEKGLRGVVGQVASPAKGAASIPLSHLSDEKAAGSSPIPEDAEAVRKFIEQEALTPSPTK
jgi:hypothetical protein